MKPFIKWAGGKRWLTQHSTFQVPKYAGRYIEPFLGGGAIFFHLRPDRAVIADVNQRLIETYNAIAIDPKGVKRELRRHQRLHSPEYYYEERSRKRKSLTTKAAQFLYLNRTCWNGLYRENLRGEFNVPIGTKSSIYDQEEDFDQLSAILRRAEIRCQDFEITIGEAKKGDFVFIDPPYTTSHNLNGFIKYNQRIFEWKDQVRLRDAASMAKKRGAAVLITNANHASIEELYRDACEIKIINRQSIISGPPSGRKATTELLIQL